MFLFATERIEFDPWKAVSGFDNAVYELVSCLKSDGMTAFMKFITFWGSEWTIAFLAAAIPFLVFVFKKKEYYLLSLASAANIALGALLSQVLKTLFQRPRPDLPKLVETVGYAFPSGHSMNSAIFYGFFAYLAVRRLKHPARYILAGALALLPLLIGISRVYLGAHYASDVLAGFIIGTGWLILFIRLAKRHIDQLQ